MNWLEEVTIRKEELFSYLEQLLSIPSVREDELATDECPVGPGPKAALAKMMTFGQEAGFLTRDFGPLVGRIDWGDDSLEPFGILGHVDVVPVGDGWDSDPFTPTYKDGKLIARGVLDDKGPLLCAFFAMKMLKEMGYSPKRQVQVIVGTDEESQWKCVDAYLEQAKLPKQGFVPDAYFPIVNGEKGVASLTVRTEESALTGKLELMEFTSGLRENMVPETAMAKVKGDDLNQVSSAFEKFLEEELPVTGNCHLAEDELVFELRGKSAHGSTPQNGVNAATYLAIFLASQDFGEGSAFLTSLAKGHLDYFGEKMGLAYSDDKMGILTLNIGLANYSQGKGSWVANIRYPQGIDMADAAIRLEKTIRTDQVTFDLDDQKRPHYVSSEHPMVKTLLRIYSEQTGLEGYERVIGGATYARLLEEGVAFGALFPDANDTMHQVNEEMTIDDILKTTAIYAQALSELVCQ